MNRDKSTSLNSAYILRASIWVSPSLRALWTSRERLAVLYSYQIINLTKLMSNRKSEGREGHLMIQEVADIHISETLPGLAAVAFTWSNDHRREEGSTMLLP